MELKNIFVQDLAGNAIPGAIGRLYLEGTTILAGFLQDKDGNPQGNPIQANVIGQLQFAAPDGRYDLYISSAARNYTIRIEFFDAYNTGLQDGLASASGSSMIGYSFGSASSVAQVLQDRLRLNPVIPQDFGAIGDGLSHPLSTRFNTLDQAKAVYPHAVALTDEIDWCAIQAALNNAKVIRIPNMVFLCNRDLIRSNTHISIFGSGIQSEIRFTAQVTYGIRITQNAGYETGCDGLFISTTVLNNGIGLSISYAGYSGEFERNKRFVKLNNIRVSGADYFSQGWRGGIELDEVTLPMLDDLLVVGYRNLNGDVSNPSTRWWPHTQFGYLYTSTNNLEPTDALFRGCDVRYAQEAYKVKGTVEGLRFKSCLAVACRKGIVDDRRAVTGQPSINPWVNVDDGHFNVAESAYESEYMYQGWFINSLIYQFGFVDSDFIGINTDYGNNIKIMGNEILGNKNSTKLTKGIRNQQNNESFVAFNNIQYVDMPIECSGTGGITGVRYFMNKGTNKQGVETQTVTYSNGSSPYTNPSSNPVGIVSEGSNPAVVNVGANGIATIASITLDSFPAGSIFRITAICQVLKGGTAGTTKLYIEKTAGDANVSYMANGTGLGVQNDSHAAGANWQASLVGIIKKTSAGPLALKMAVSSNGSNASISALDGQYVLERIA